MLRLQVTALDDPAAQQWRFEFDDRAEIVLGRRGGVDVLLPHPRVSLVHARIERRGADWLLADLGSTNGTRLSGAPLPAGQKRPLRDGDRIVIGAFLLQVGLDAQAGQWRPEASSSLARHMAREVLERLGPGAAVPQLAVLDGPQAGVVLTLAEVGRTWLLGRAGAGDLRLDDVDPWRERAALVRDDEGVTVRELQPGVLTVNGEALGGARRLRDGDRLVFAGTPIRFDDPAEVYLRKLADAATPDERAEPERAARRPEIALWLLGAAAIVAAAGALAWVLR